MTLSDEEKLIRQTARRLSRERIVPFAAEWDRNSIFPKEVVAELGKLGLMGVTVPEDQGGTGATYTALALALEEIAYGDAGVATAMSGHNCVGCMPLVKFGTPAQKQRFLRPLASGKYLSAFLLTEPQGGSDAGSPKTTATRAEKGDYILNGVKQFITSGKYADLALIFAATSPDKGPKGVSAFLVPTDTPGYNVIRTENKMGQRSSDTCQIALENLRVPAENLLGVEDDGFRIALGNLEGGRIGIAAVAVGIAQAALDQAVAYARERVVFSKPIFEHQAVQFRLSEMATRVATGRQLYLAAAALYDQDEPCLKEACMAKLVASENAERVCSDAIQTLGGYGYLADYPVERLLRDAIVTKIYEGTNDIQKLVIARHL
ncbi:MAG: acyl-CoA dehydrogenase family protein [Rhodobacteraceae bacterium]|nr:acyl-CoA dehydrogenase family protein [Paracoccaceae bacterium]